MNIFDLKNRTALITGGTGWLGFEFCKILALNNANIILATRNYDKGLDTINKLKNLIDNNTEQFFHIIELDMNYSQQVINNKFKELEVKFKKIDILINNSVQFIDKDIFNINLAEFNKYQHQNGYYFYLSKLARDLAIKNNSSCNIVNIGSMYGSVSSYPDVYTDLKNSSSIAYHTLKGGLINMTKHMAVYWAKDNIRVNSLSPGAFPKKTIDNNFKNKLEKKIPLGRIGKPSELSGPLLLLVSDAGSYMTGHNLIVDGGWTIQ